MIKRNIHNLKSVWKYFKKYKINLIVFIIITFLIGLSSVLLPLVTAKIITNINASNVKKILLLGALFFLLNIIINILKYINNKNYYKFQGKAVKEIRLDYCKKILDVDTKIFDVEGSGLFLGRFSTDLVTFSYIFSQLINNINSIIINLGVYIIIFVINPVIGIFFVISSIILFMVNKIRIKKRNIIWREYKKIDEKNQSIFSEMLRGVRDLKVLDLKKGMLNYMDINFDNNRKKSYQMDMINTKYDFFNDFITQFIMISFLLICSLFLVKGSLSAANFLVLFMYQNKVFNAIFDIAHLQTEMNLFELCSKNILEIMSNDGFKKESYGDVNLEKIDGKLEFRNVSFGYKKDIEILKDVSFIIHPLTKTAFFGKSGVGKTTIINLISRLYDLDSGSIYIDNHDITTLTKNTLKKAIAVITQTPYIFNLSIYDNLTLVKDNVTKKEIVEVCKLVELHEFISNLPDGYDTMLGEDGVNLSGGQKQRLSIARALLKGSKIIIFDESTNSLDKRTKHAIERVLNKIKKDHTIIVISHDFTSIEDCDEIFLMDKGYIVDSGTHKELLATNKLYKKIYKE